MEVLFRRRKLQKECASEDALRRRYGERRARLLMRRLRELEAAESLEDIRALPGPRAHELTGDRSGQVSLDLEHPWRLIVEPADEVPPTKDDGGLDWASVREDVIVEIVDTH